MRQMLAAFSVTLAMACPRTAIGDPSIRDLALRTELHPIETLTVSVRQFLTGDKNGKPFTITGINLVRVAGGRIAEEWVVFDRLGLLQQLGVVPAPGQSAGEAPDR